MYFNYFFLRRFCHFYSWLPALIMTEKKSTFLVIAIILHAFSVILFLHGFLWQSTNLAVSRPVLPIPPLALQNDSSDLASLNQESARNIDKLVIFLIDALRADFALDHDSRMSFVKQELARGGAKGFVGKARTPTALTTGAIPSFVDVILNFGTQTSMKDNFIDRLTACGQRLVFYGDDTWLRMFPKSFHRSEGVTSFLVSDYTEVDDNVTRNLAGELERDDWDVMILHYLGLDHIGHLAGPRSSLVGPKLREMDRLLEQVYGKMARKNEKNLVVVLGDHGMTDAGTHGGASQPEIDTPMVFLSSSFPTSLPTMASTSNLPNPSVYPIINQVDLVSTIALLTGVDVPVENTGIAIFDVMTPFMDRQTLQSGVCRLTTQIASLLPENDIPDSDDAIKVGDVEKLVCRSNISASEEEIRIALNQLKMAAKSLSSRSTDYGDASMAVSFLLMLFCAIWYCWELKSGYTVPKSSFTFPEKMMLAMMTFHVVSMGSSSFTEEEHQLWYMWIPTVYVLLMLRAYWSSGWKSVMSYGLLLLLHRVGREWNRTGDKWLHVPDIGDWLREPEHCVFLYALLAASVFTMIRLAGPLGAGNNVYSVGLSSAGFFHFFQQNIFAWISYITVAVICIQCLRRNGSREHYWSLRNSFLVLACVIVRPHNVPLIAVMVAMESVLSDICWATKLPFKTVGLIYWLQGWTTFFLFGNSNAISSVDVSAGFAGISFYCAPLHGALIFCQIYIGPVFWLLSLVRTFSWRTSLWRARKELVLLFLLFRLMTLLVVFGNAAIQRHHLFVWTVFAPKVMFESVHALFVCFSVLWMTKVADDCGRQGLGEAVRSERFAI